MQNSVFASVSFCLLCFIARRKKRCVRCARGAANESDSDSTCGDNDAAVAADSTTNIVSPPSVLSIASYSQDESAQA